LVTSVLNTFEKFRPALQRRVRTLHELEVHMEAYLQLSDIAEFAQ
jgi:hypothetical protein